MAQYATLMGYKYTLRFCRACSKITKFEYNAVKGHSSCKICGGWQCFDISRKTAIKHFKKKEKVGNECKKK
jgi:hypothetical protein